MDAIYWDHYYDSILILNLVIVIALLTSLRLFSGTISHINATDELLKKDNPAFGISLAAATFGMAIMLSGTIYGTQDDDPNRSAMVVGLFGITGIVMMAMTRLILAKITLPRVSLRNEITKGNIAVAVADAGNIIAAAIVIRSVLAWVYVDSIDGIGTLFVAYLVSQVLLTSMTILRMKIFGAINKGYCLQDELNKGNTALALRFSGQKIGIAFAIATAAQIVVYEEYDISQVMSAWVVASLAAIIIWKILSFIAEKIILLRVNINYEVLEQKNIAIGVLQAAIYISLGMLIWSI